MHFEILVEDQSGKKALDILVPKIIGNDHTFRVHPYKGIGRLPMDLRTSADPCMRILMEQLPRLLNGYGATFDGYPPDYHAVVILVCDLDDKCLKDFREKLFEVLNSCYPKPETHFCIAIEEGEAWYMGDLPAVKAAYPNARNATLNSYVNDSISGTWEKLADAIYSGGYLKLSSKGRQMIGAEKSKWAEAITPHMDVANNRSPSFCYFRDKLQELTGIK